MKQPELTYRELAARRLKCRPDELRGFLELLGSKVVLVLAPSGQKYSLTYAQLEEERERGQREPAPTPPAAQVESQPDAAPCPQPRPQTGKKPIPVRKKPA